MVTTKDVEDEIRDIINWIVIFNEEYNLPEEVVSELRSKLEQVARHVGEL